MPDSTDEVPRPEKPEVQDDPEARSERAEQRQKQRKQSSAIDEMPSNTFKIPRI